MDPNYNRPYQGPPPNGPGGPPPPGPPLSPRPYRNSPDPAPVPAPAPLQPSASAAATRAQKYDDEKKRIATTCFHKLDEQGKPLQSYITHIRVEEDAVYQSSPPPPGHPPHHKKPRVIIVAVKNNGRVSMHKARENDDLSFQIGKTWPLEELQSVESFSNLAQRPAEDEVRAKWAGPTGFIITMAKPYYWQAKTAKEKDFFVSSLVKIYNKYTEGKVPELIGFEPRVKDEIMAATKPPEAFNPPPRADNLPPPLSTGPAGRPPGPPGSAPRPPFSQDQRPISPSVASDGRSASGASSELQRPPVSGPRPLQQPPRASPVQSPPPQSANRSRYASPQLSQRPSQEHLARQRPSQDHDQLRTAYAKSPPPPAAAAGPPPNNVYSGGRRTPQGSRTNLAEPPSAPIPPIISPRRQAERSRVRQDANGSITPLPPLEPKSLSTVPTHSSATSQDSNASYGAQSRSIKTPPPLNNEPTQTLPERRRPPMEDSNAETGSRDFSAPQEQNHIPPFMQSQTYANLSTRKASTSSSILEALGSQEIPSAPTPNSRQPETQNGTEAPSATEQSPTSPPYAAPQDIAAAMPPSFSPISTKAPAPQLPTSSPTARSPPPPAEHPATSAPPISTTTTTTTAAATTPTTTTTTSPTTEKAEPDSETEPQFRPGLGPMMGGAKKADVASKFRKAVAAHTAFKPRAGGAGDRLFGSQAKSSNEPDGITGVVPARSAARDVKPEEPNPSEQDSQQKEKPSVTVPQTEAPSIQIDSPISPEKKRDLVTTNGLELTTSADSQTSAPSDRQRPSRSPKRISKKRKSNPFESALVAMGVDPSVMQGRQIEFEDILNDFGWDRGFLQSKKMATMETDLKREIDRLEAGSWLGHTDRKDDRVDVVEKLLNKTIAECEEVEGLLTLYSVELSTLNEDIAFIEAQSQGLQVQTANQKLLQTELQSLIETISLNTHQLDPLRAASLSDAKGLDLIENTLLLLYKALRTIDPTSLNRDHSGIAPMDTKISMTSMRALQERKESYLSETNTFLHRLRHYVEPTYGAAFHRTKDAFNDTNASTRDMVQLHDIARVEMWRYSPLMLFAKEVNRDAWLDMIRVYQGRARETYQDELRQVIQEWKRRSRKMTGEEQEALFTAQEKESEGLTSTARKLTVKRSQTLAKGLRQTSNEKKFGFGQRRDGNQYPFEIFTGTLTELLPVIATEQNFFVDFFHMTTLEGFDFPEAVTSEPPAQRRGTDLSGKRSLEPDRDTSRRVIDSMEGIFASLQNEMQSLIDWALKQDQFQCIGILYALERAIAEHSDTSQEFVSKILTKLHDALGTIFTRFVDDQVRAIEATKVNIKKRKGVMAFIKVFPNFSALIENMLPPSSEVKSEKLQIRIDVDNAYDRINKAMFSSLKQIAKEGPHRPPSINTSSTGGGIGVISNADSEDKEALNHEILLIENMYYYYTEVDEKNGSPVLGTWRGKAMLEMSEHQDRYVSAVIRRPLGRLLDFIEGVEALLLTAHADPKNIPTEHPSFSRAALKKMLASHYDGRESRRGVDALKKRIDKHFGESSEDVSINQRLMTQILGDCERKYLDAFSRLEKLVRDVYGGDVEVEFSKADIANAFKR